MAEKKRFYIVVNPVGGSCKGLSILKEVKPILERAGVELTVKETEYAGHACDIANTVDISSFEALCVIGGDGTMHEVINGMLTRKDNNKLPLGLIPGGTGVSFMYDLDCLDPVVAAEWIVRGNTRPIDVASVKMGEELIYTFNVVGWGMVTDIMLMAEKMRWLRQHRYNVATVINLIMLKHRRARLIIDGEEQTGEFIFAMGCNTIHTGKAMKMAPHAKLDDGLLDLVVVRKTGRFHLLGLFPKIFDGSHLSSPAVDYYQVKKFSIIPDDDVGLIIDGNFSGRTPIEVDVLPGAIRVFC
ncbi:diacylglycerol kinase family lipid kinase [bacterium]|nr:diacylglycerol kinase family lipid kinase [bacterium]